MTQVKQTSRTRKNNKISKNKETPTWVKVVLIVPVVLMMALTIQDFFNQKSKNALLSAEKQELEKKRLTYQEKIKQKAEQEWGQYKLPAPLDFSYESTTDYQILYLKPISSNVYHVVSSQKFKSSGNTYYDKSLIDCNISSYAYIVNHENLFHVLQTYNAPSELKPAQEEGSAYHKIKAVCA